MLRGLLEIQEKQQKRAGTFFAKVKSVFRNQAAGSFKNSFKSSRGDLSTTASASSSPRPPSQEPPSASSSGKWSLSTPRGFRVPFLSRFKSDDSQAGLSRSRSRSLALSLPALPTTSVPSTPIRHLCFTSVGYARPLLHISRRCNLRSTPARHRAMTANADPYITLPLPPTGSSSPDFASPDSPAASETHAESASSKPQLPLQKTNTY